MKNLNLPPFYVGQKIVYVTGLNMPKDSVHVVSKIIRPSCGCIFICIENDPFGKHDYQGKFCTCTLCGSLYKSGGSEYIWDPASFRPLQQQNFPLITLSKIREKEKEEYLVAN